MKIRKMKNKTFAPAKPSLTVMMNVQWQKNVERIRAFNKEVGFTLFNEDTFISQEELDFYASYNIFTSEPFFTQKLAA